MYNKLNTRKRLLKKLKMTNDVNIINSMPINRIRMTVPYCRLELISNNIELDWFNLEFGSYKVRCK